MNKSIFLSIICALCALAAAAQTYSGGSGTEADPYLISSKADMETLATAVNSGNSYSGKYFLLTQDITEAVTTIIGNYNPPASTKPFSGLFDGGGHNINVNISTTAWHAGVFGYVSSATIKNLGVTGSVTRTSNDDAYVGGICGYASSTTIDNCYNTGNISLYSSHVGGICGSALSTTINNCYNIGNISLYSFSSSVYAGGICGYVYSGTTVSNCYNIGNISAAITSSSSYSPHVGSISGYGSGIIKNCIAANTTITTKQADSYNSTNAGRIVGTSSVGASFVTIQNCYALATMQINDFTRSSQDTNSEDGKDENILSFQSQSWIEENLNWDFNDIWHIPETNSFPVLKIPLTLLFSLSNTTIAYGSVPITFTISSNNTMTSISVTSSDNNIAEIGNGIITIKKAGAVTISAYQASTDIYGSSNININLTVNKVPLDIQADDITSIYGDIPQFTCKYEGFVNNETENVLTKLPSFSCSGTATSNVGNYTITPSGAEAENYTFTYKNGLLKIEKRDLRVIPDNLSRLYGDNNPTLTLQYEGFVNGNTVSNISTRPTATTIATQTSPIGNYEITCSGGNATNYNFIYEKGNLEITKAPLTITAHNKNRYWGVENPALTFSYSGFKNYENESVLTEQPQISCVVERLSPSGQYPIIISGGAAPNYNIIRTNGIFTVNKNPQPATVSLNFSNLNLVSGMGNVLKLSIEQEDPVLSFQTDITFPAFVSVDLDKVTLSNRCDNAHILNTTKVPGLNNTYRFLIYSPSNKAIAGNTGELITIPLIIDWNTVAANYANYSASTSATTAVFYISETDKPEKSIPSASATFYVHRMGDVNINGTVTISDIVAEVDYILGKNPQPFLFEAGDMNKNGVISILDLTLLVNAVLTQSSYSPSLRSSANSGYELLLSNLELNYSKGITTGNLILSMKNPNPVIALNWDLSLPENVTIDEDKLAFASDRTNRNRHTIAVNKLPEGNTWRFVVYSSQNQEISGNSGELIVIPVVINEQTAIGQFPVTPSAANLIYSENGALDEITPTCVRGILANGVEINSIIETLCATSLHVYPNPAKDYIFIQSESPVEKIEIYNQSGICILINNNVPEKLDVSSLASGFYLARIYVDGIPVSKKIVIEK